MALRALILLLAFSTQLAYAVTAKCFWNAPPFTYLDGTPLPASDIDHYTVTWTPAPGQSGPSGSINVPPSLLSVPVTIPCGATTFTLSVTTNSKAHVANATSAPTAGIAFDSGVACGPGTPTGFMVQ